MIDWILNRLFDRIIQSRGMWVVREEGSAFGVKRDSELHSRFRINMNGISQWGNGQTSWDKAFGPVIINDSDGNPARCLFEFNGPGNLPLGIMLNNYNDAISITAENGQLVIRDERHGTTIDLAFK